MAACLPWLSLCGWRTCGLLATYSLGKQQYWLGATCCSRQFSRWSYHTHQENPPTYTKNGILNNAYWSISVLCMYWLGTCVADKLHLVPMHLLVGVLLVGVVACIQHRAVNWTRTSLSPSQQTVFQITPLNWTEWFAVLCFSIPVIFLDEFLKYLSRSLGELKPPTLP